MARIITKELAKKIIKKLKGRKSGGKGAAHTEYLIEHEGQVIEYSTRMPVAVKRPERSNWDHGSIDRHALIDAD